MSEVLDAEQYAEYEAAVAAEIAVAEVHVRCRRGVDEAFDRVRVRLLENALAQAGSVDPSG